MRVRWLAGLLFGAILAAAAPAHAQVEDEMIVVTGSRIMSDVGNINIPMPELPYISIAVPADFVIFTVTLESATRSVDERRRELERSFQSLGASVARVRGISMEVGRPGDSSPLETAAAREAIEPDEDDYERSLIPVVLKFAVQSGDTFLAVRTRAETFIDDLDVSGRVEAVMGDEQYIGVAEPKRHREDLLRRIAEDTRLIQSIFGGGGGAEPPSIALTGLEGRVKTRPIGPLELEMYIPYSVSLASGRGN